MCKLKVEIDYIVAASIIKGLRGSLEPKSVQRCMGFLDKLEQILDRAVQEQGGNNEKVS